ncbi:class I SAM-dependent methyltransferase [Aquabacterium sp.]|uniref:class I SAM-dependent methyltransferase n=1 Tax=Aquabacterium sp. TaxID=1872578 RepID=UPI00199D3B81|nr:class I SAM-dependent methyltransferase [Aquabacterium sp.]MBC7700933.1 class I SAM-dependent methyltransferase [Aquabacterium sp.]
MEPKSIDTLHRTKTGKISDKWASYLPYYDTLFAPLRDQPIQLLEIGVQNGGSQETWAQYFQSAELFVGCDIDPKCEALRYDDPRIKIVVGDANGAPAFQKITALSTAFDIVIDDGSHTSHDIMRSFVNYFPLLKPGGVFVVEDTCCLYMDAFGGGILNEFNAYAFFKRLVDVVNFQFWKNDLSISNYLRSYFDLRSTPAFILDGWIESVEFRNSIITIKKSLTPTHEKLGERITVGSEAQVQNWGGKLP